MDKRKIARKVEYIRKHYLSSFIKAAIFLLTVPFLYSQTTNTIIRLLNLNSNLIQFDSETSSFTSQQNPQIIISSPRTNLNNLGNVLGVSDSSDKQINVKILDPELNETKGVYVKQSSTGKLEVDIKKQAQFKPGAYTVVAKIGGEEIRKEFTWGVLAINTDKDSYKPGEEAYIQMASLSPGGHTICDSDLRLEVAKPNGDVERIKVNRSGECKGDNITRIPDYISEFKFQNVGTYKFTLTNLNYNYEISKYIQVKTSIPFIIKRSAPTRIYPFANYDMRIKITASKDFKGVITEKVPATFVITDHKTTVKDGFQYIKWDTEIKRGETKEFKYTFDAPNISPEIYRIGELQIGKYTGLAQWQIASDAVQTITDWFSATGSWTAPSGITSVTVKAWGGGGTGGPATGTTSGAGGGAGGQYAQKVVAVTPLSSYSFTVAAAKASATATVIAGDDTTFNTNVVVAKGGAGGLNATGATSNGGTGSTTGGIGDTVYAGGNGGNGVSSTQSGGGGGGAGDGGAGGNGSGATAGNGTSVGGGNGGAGVTTANTRNAGSRAGGGGSGGLSSTTTDRSGGNGGPGQLGITYTAEFPKVEATSQNVNNSNTTSHAITMPSGIVAGELLVIVFSSDGAPTITDGSGLWSKLGQASNSTVATQAIFYKVATGGDTATLTTSVIEQTSHIVYRISGASGVVTGTSANGSSTNSNPASHDSTTTTNKLWIATRGGDSTVVATVTPFGFDSIQTQAAGGTGGASTNTAIAYSNRQTYDPDIWTSATEQWVTYTLAIEPTSGIDISGRVYSDQGSTGIGANKTVNLKVNGAGSYTTETDANGDWQITALVNNNDVVTVYLDNETEKATTIFISGATNQTGIDLYTSTLIVRSQTSSAITPDNLYIADDGDTDVKYLVSAASNGNLTVDTGIDLWIWTGDEFNLSGGSLTTQGSGDLILAANSLSTLDTATNTVSGDILVNGGATLTINATTNVDGGDITTSGTSAIVTTTSGTPNINLNGTGTIGGGTTPTLNFHDITIANSVTTTISSSISIQGGDLTTVGTGSVTYTNTPAVTVSGTGNIGGGSSTLYFYSLAVGDSTTDTSTVQSPINAAYSLNILANQTVNLSSNNLTVGSSSISGSGALTVNGSLNQTSSATTTILSNTSDAILTGSGTFTPFNLTIGNGTNTISADLETGDLTTDILGNLIISANATLKASSSAQLSIAGNYTNNGTFTSNSGSIVFDAGDSGNTIEGTITGSSSFNNIQFNNAAGSWSFQNNATILGNFTITTATQVAAPSVLTVNGNFVGSSSFSAGTGTVVLAGAGGSTQTLQGSTTFYNLTAAATSSRTIAVTSSTTQRITNNLTISGDSCTAIIMLRSTSKGNQWTIDDDAGGTTLVDYVDVQDSNSIDQAITASSSSNSGNNSNWTIASSSCIGGSTSTNATKYTFQRKTFYDNTNSNYWLTYQDGDEIEFRRSNDTGTSWSNTSTESNSRLPYNSYDFSLWNKSISSTEYIFFTVTDNYDIKLRVGTLSSSNITWDNDVSTVFNGSGTSDEYLNTYVTLDSSNYIWVTAVHKTGSNYTFKSIRSNQVASTDLSTLTWGSAKSFTYPQAETNVYGNILPLANQDMYAVFALGTSLVGCMWDNDDTGGRWENSDGQVCEPDTGATSDWYSRSWPYRVKLTIDDTKVDADLTDFVVYVDLNDLPPLFHTFVNQTDGRDIRVTKADGTTELAREVVYYDSSNDTGELHFQYTGVLSNTVDTDVYIYFGNTGATDYAATDPYGRNAVWDNNMMAVYHLNESGNGTADEYADSTGINHGTGGASGASPTQTVTAKQGKAQDFDGSNDIIETGYDSSLDPTGYMTVSTWFKVDQLSSTLARTQHIVRRYCASCSSSDSYEIYIGTDDAIRFGIQADGPGSGSNVRTTTGYVTTGVWYHVTGIWDASGMRIYINGVNETALVNNPPTGTYILTSTDTLRLGAQNSSSNFVDGVVDEIQLHDSARSDGWITTTYKNQSDPSTFFSQFGSVEFAGYEGGWDYRMQLAIDATKVPNQDLTQFPVLVSNTKDLWKSTANGGNVQQSDGGDISFTASDGYTKLSHEIEKYDPATGELVAWVMVPTVYHASNTNIYVYYGNSSTSNHWNSANTWTNYNAVWHMAESGNGTVGEFVDSTGVNNGQGGAGVSTATPTQVTSGKIGNAQNFDGTDDWISVPDNATLKPTNYITVSAWVNFDQLSSTKGSDQYIARKACLTGCTGSDSSYSIYTDINDRIYFTVEDSGTSSFSYARTDNSAITAGNWYLITGVWSAGGLKVYINGTDSTFFVGDAPSGNTVYSTDTARIGATNSTLYFLDGKIDQVYIKSGGNSADWIQTEYNNQNNPATFFSTWGAEEFGGLQSGWQFRSKLTIDSTKVDENLTDYPVFLDLSNMPGNFHAGINQTDARDIRITKSDGTTEIPREVVSYNSTNDTGEVHFKYTGTLSSTVDTDIYIYYGNVNATNHSDTSAYGRNNVWTNGYAGVWHLKESGNGTVGEYADSRGTNSGQGGGGTGSQAPTQTDGNLNKAQSFDGGDYISIPDHSSLDITSNISVSAWIRSTASQDQFDKIIAKNKNTYYPFQMVFNGAANDKISFTLSDTTQDREVVSNSDIPQNTWTQVTGTYDGSTIRLYVNGSVQTDTEVAAFTVETNNNPLFIGGRDTSQQFTGGIDEVRVSSVTRSSGWVSTEYNNQSSPSTFFNNWGQSFDLIDTIPSNSEDNLSGVIDSSYNVHISYIDDEATDRVSHKKWTNSTKTWGSATQVSDSPSDSHTNTSISVDTSTPTIDDIYISWIDSSNDDIMYRKFDSSLATWDTAVVLNNTGVNRSPSLNYSGENRIFLVSTKSATSPVTINWQSIVAPSGGGSSPVVSSVLVNGGTAITLTEGTTTSVSWTATITDSDGHANISTASGKLYRSGVAGAHNCTNNNANCYEVISCSLSGCAGNSCTATCTANIQFFADPTDTGSPNAAEHWRGWIEAFDVDTNSGNAFTTGTVDLQSLAALDITNSISYGPLLPGDDTGSSPKTTTVTNTGNTIVDLELSGDDLCSDYPTCSGPQIGVGYQEFSTNTFTYGAGTGLNLTPQFTGINLSKATSAPSNSTMTMYWGLGIPTPKEDGIYTGQNIVTAINGD